MTSPIPTIWKRSRDETGAARRQIAGATRREALSAQGRQRHLGSLTISLLRDPEGRPERFLAVIDDITARKRVEAALHESEVRLKLAREAAGFGVWEWNDCHRRADLVGGAVAPARL